MKFIGKFGLKSKILFIATLVIALITIVVTVVLLNKRENIELHLHNFGEWQTVLEPTCEEEGRKEKLCGCGKNKIRFISAKGHSFGEWYVLQNATEDENGFMRRKCECGFCETREYSLIGDVAGVLYVDSQAQENGNGSFESPFTSIDDAKDRIRDMDKQGLNEIVVYVSAGEYFTEGLAFTAEDSGSADCPIVYRAFGGKTVINGGVSIDAESFVSSIEYPEIYARLPEGVRDKVLVADLFCEKYNLSKEDYGDINTVGTYTTADRYKDGRTGGMYSELFVDGHRQTLARYPNDEYLLTGEPIVEGVSSSEAKENGDPMGDKFKIDGSLASRIASWQDAENVWAFGFWKYDWADSSTLIESIDCEKNEITYQYQSFFGTKEGAPYYFYNCLEELDAEGEYYIDRDNGLLCYYPEDDIDDLNITLSLTSSSILEINANYLSFEGFTITGTRENAIIINANNVNIKDCTISGVGGTGIWANGQNLRIVGNTLTGIGRDGIAVSGGDSATLTSSDNLVQNNLIHDFAEVYRTYRAGISLCGVGNICSHNELFNSPHLAITYSGNNNIVEYNLIHDVCLEADDAGAIYAGRSWSSYGNHIRYNLIYGLGDNGHAPDGIYMDDAISGQNIYGNILIDIPKFAIHIGGGRDMNVYGNLIISDGECAIRYDARAREGILNETWFSTHVLKESGDLWIDLYTSPWQTEIWQNAFPQYKNTTDDFSMIEDASFFANPSSSNVSGNIIYSRFAKIGNIDGDVKRFSEIGDNTTLPYAIYSIRYGGVSCNDYSEVLGALLRKKLDGFDDIQLDSIGRQ